MYLGRAVGNLLNVLDPDLLVLGGGLMEACGEFLLPLVRESADSCTVKTIGDPTPIVLSELQDDAVVLGAGAMAHELYRGEHPTSGSPYAPQIDWIGPGEIQINGRRYVDDVIVRADGTVKKRRKKLSLKTHGSTHLISAEEVKYICKGKPQTLVVGCGTDSRLELGEDAEKWLAKHDVALVCKESSEAVLDYQRNRGPRALLVHVRH